MNNTFNKVTTVTMRILAVIASFTIFGFLYKFFTLLVLFHPTENMKALMSIFGFIGGGYLSIRLLKFFDHKITKYTPHKKEEIQVAPGQQKELNYKLFTIIVLVVAVALISYGYSSGIRSSSDDVYFENNLKCSKLLPEQMERYRSETISSPEVFYSPKLKTCLSAYLNYNPGLTRYVIEDILTNKIIFSGQVDDSKDGNFEKVRTEFREKIDKLK